MSRMRGVSASAPFVVSLARELDEVLRGASRANRAAALMRQGVIIGPAVARVVPPGASPDRIWLTCLRQARRDALTALSFLPSGRTLSPGHHGLKAQLVMRLEQALHMAVQQGQGLITEAEEACASSSRTPVGFAVPPAASGRRNDASIRELLIEITHWKPTWDRLFPKTHPEAVLSALRHLFLGRGSGSGSADADAELLGIASQWEIPKTVLPGSTDAHPCLSSSSHGAVAWAVLLRETLAVQRRSVRLLRTNHRIHPQVAPSQALQEAVGRLNYLRPSENFNSEDVEALARALAELLAQPGMLEGLDDLLQRIPFLISELDQPAKRSPGRFSFQPDSTTLRGHASIEALRLELITNQIEFLHEALTIRHLLERTCGGPAQAFRLDGLSTVASELMDAASEQDFDRALGLFGQTEHLPDWPLDCDDRFGPYRDILQLLREFASNVPGEDVRPSAGLIRGALRHAALGFYMENWRVARYAWARAQQQK
jgi:hypothetical protein